MISVSFFHVFTLNNREKCTGGGVLARFYRPGGVGVLNSFFARGDGEFAHQKNWPRGGGGGGGEMVRLGID